VSIDGSPVTLLYVSGTQVNAVAPMRLSGATARVHVSFNGVATPDFVTAVAPASPEVFQSVDGAAAAVNQDGSINSAEHPAQPGSIIAIWATGIGAPPFGAWQDGQLATGALDFGCCQVDWAGGRPVDVMYGGAAPGIVAGVVQVNFRAPGPFVDVRLGSGTTVYVTLSSGGVSGHPVQIYVAVPD
jgi:uncharacterized protein (TIGR03437 family)